MSEFFDWLNDYVPLGLVIILWWVLFPIRVLALTLLPSSAWRASHLLNPLYEFVAFEDTP